MNVRLDCSNAGNQRRTGITIAAKASALDYILGCVPSETDD